MGVWMCVCERDEREIPVSMLAFFGLNVEQNTVEIYLTKHSFVCAI